MTYLVAVKYYALPSKDLKIESYFIEFYSKVTKKNFNLFLEYVANAIKNHAGERVDSYDLLSFSKIIEEE